MSSQSLKDISTGRRDLWILPPKHLNIEKDFNVRKDFGDLNPLVDYIIKNGAEKLPPLLVRLGPDGKYYVTDGERRTRAARLAIERGHKILGLPCIMEPRGYTDLERALSFSTRNAGKPLTILEESNSFRRAQGMGATPKQIAEFTGFSLTHIKDGLSLLTASEQVIQMIEKGKIAASLVIDLIRETKGDADALEKQVTEAVETAEKEGKEHASRKHLKSAATSAASSPTTPPATIPPGSQTTDWKQVNSNPSTGGGNGGGGGGQPLSKDTTKNLDNFNKWLDKQNREDFIPAQWDLLEATINYLEGSTDIKPIKKLLLKKDVE